MQLSDILFRDFTSAENRLKYGENLMKIAKLQMSNHVEDRLMTTPTRETTYQTIIQ